MTLETNAAPPSPPQTPPAMPVAALRYHRAEPAALPLEMKVVVLAAAVYGAFGVMTLMTNLWIFLEPALFRTVRSGFRSLRSVYFVVTLEHGIAGVLLVAGAAAFYARRPACRPLLMAGAVGVLLGIGISFGHYLFFSRDATTATVADRVVMSIWQGGSIVSASLLPVLLLIVMTRPAAKALFGKPG